MPEVDYTPLIDEVRGHVRSGTALLKPHRLVACIGSRMALSLFVNATEPAEALVGATTSEAIGLDLLRSKEADLLICTDRLEQGNGGSLVESAKQLQPAPTT